jgi:hypothetical protein
MGGCRIGIAGDAQGVLRIWRSIQEKLGSDQSRLRHGQIIYVDGACW